MGLFNKKANKSKTINRFELVTDKTNGFYAWNGKLYQNDIIRACIRPKTQAIGKLVAKHLQGDTQAPKNFAYIKMLLKNPNPYMTGQMLQEKMANQLALNNNAFALVVRNENGLANGIYPITSPSVQTEYNNDADLFLKFTLNNGNMLTVPYADVIHLRRDYNEDEIFGTSPMLSLAPLMTVVTTIDQGIINAIKNSAVVKWLLKFVTSTNEKDMGIKVEEFAKNYLNVNNSKGGVIAQDPAYAVEQVKQNENYIPNAAQMNNSVSRIYNFFNTNEKIINSSYDDDEWNSYFEAEIEPLSMQMSNEFTNKLFSIKERAFKNIIIFDASNLQYSSMKNKLGLVAMVDRGAMTPNEWRQVMNLSPIPGGDEPIRRLDTAVVDDNNKGDE